MPLYNPNFLASRRTFVRTLAAAPILASFAIEDLMATFADRRRTSTRVSACVRSSTPAERGRT